DRFTPGVDGRSHLGLQFPAHAVHPRRSLGKRPPRARLLAVTIRLPVGRDEAFDLFLLQILQIRLRAIPTVGHDFLRRLSRLLADGFQRGLHLLFIIGGLGHALPHYPLQVGFPRNLGVVGLHKPVRPGHDARLRIGEVILHLGFGLGLLLRLVLTLGLLSRSLFQRPLGFLDPLPSRFPPPQLRRQFVSPTIPSVVCVLFLIRRFGLLQ